MIKYIPADKLTKKFEKMIDDIPASVDSGAGYVIDEVYKIIDTLRQEYSEVDLDLDADIEMEWDSFNKHLAEYGGESEEVVWLNRYNFNEIASHFYELGLNAKNL